MKQVFKNKDTGDEVVHSDGKTMVRNPAAETQITTTPEMIKIETGVSQFIKLSVANGIEMQDGVNSLKISISGGIEISDGTKTTTLSLLQLLHNDGAGKTNSITEEQVVISDGTNLNVIEAGSINVGNGDGGSTAITPAHILLDAGSGSTNSISDEQMIIDGADKTAIYEGQGVSLTASGGSLDLTVDDGLQNTADGNTLGASGTGGIYHSGGGATAALSKSAGLQLSDGSSGTVTVDVQAGEAISFQATEGCDVDEAEEPITTTTKVLRGAVTEA